MQEFSALAGIIAALAVGVVSPGPSFVMVARVAVATSRAQGIAASAGMGAGGVLFAVIALLGLQGVLLAVPALYLALKLVGGLYLCYLGYLIFRHAREPLSVTPNQRQRGSRAGARSFWLGFTTQVSNPKTAIVYASVFAAFLPPHFSSGFATTLLLVVFLIEAGWYATVALLLSSAGPRQTYLACKAWVDRGAGLVLIGLGLKLVTSTARP